MSAPTRVVNVGEIMALQLSILVEHYTEMAQLEWECTHLAKARRAMSSDDSDEDDPDW